jgi:glutaredoxin
LDTQVLGISVDHVPCLKAWADSLGGINYPLLSDFWPHGAEAEKYGVLRSEGYTERAIFVIDKEGIIRYIDIHDIDEQPSNEELVQVIRQIDPEVADRQVEAEPPEKLELPHGGIIMYCTSWCSDCKKARLWLEQNHLEYTEVDVTGTPGAAAQVRAWADGNLVTPVFDIDGTIILDFDEQKLRETLQDRL